MIIHVVQPGDTIFTIADYYGKDVYELIKENDLTDYGRLVVGETISIVYPKQRYLVQYGDTLEGIAENFNISTMELLRNNPSLIEEEVLNPGSSIIISYEGEKISEISTFGYVFPYVDLSVIEKSLPFLTYITISRYSFTFDGRILDIQDEDIIQLAKKYLTVPVMTVSSIGVDLQVVHNILKDDDLQNDFIDQILNIVQRKGYEAVNIDFFYILPIDVQQFVDFISKLSLRLKNDGFILFVSTTVTTFEMESGRLISGYDYNALGNIADNIIITSYTNGAQTYCIPELFIPYSNVQGILEEIIIQIPREKIILEFSIVGYYVRLPFIQGESTAYSISNVNAGRLASQVNTEVHYDPVNLLSHFTYVDTYEYVVVYNDERKAAQYALLIQLYGIGGVAIWNLAFYPRRTWMMINTLFDIKKIE